MKALGTFLLTLTIFASNVALTNHHFGRTCVAAATVAGQMPLAIISAVEVFDKDTGLTSALLVSITYTESSEESFRTYRGWSIRKHF